MLKRLISIICCFLMCLNLVAVAEPIQNNASYQEASDWAVNDLNKAQEYGLITDRIRSKMNAPMTREEFCEVIIKLYEKLSGKTAAYSDMSAFTDTKNPEVFKAYNLGIVGGVGNNLFNPNAIINREQLATMMYRAFKAIYPNGDFKTEGVERFSDQDSISSWALEPMRYMYKQGIVKGTGNNCISPSMPANREQAVIMATRTYEGNSNSKNDTIASQNDNSNSTFSFTAISTFDISGKTTDKVLQIAKKYYDISHPKIEQNLLISYNSLAIGNVYFDGSYQNPIRANELTNIVPFSIISNGTENFSLALACAAFSKAVNYSNTAHNLAAAINFYAELGENKVEIKNDAILVYQYAVSINPEKIDTLVNLGNVYMDLDQYENAKILFEEALKLDDKYYRARQGMASYYIAKGDKERAKKELEEDNIRFPATSRVMQDKSEIIADPELVPDVKATDSAEVAKAAIDKLKNYKPISTADFIEEFDPIDAQMIRNKVNNLPKEDFLYLPKVTSIAQIYTYKDMCTDKGSIYFEEFSVKVANFLENWLREFEDEKKESLEDFGIEFDQNGNVTVDIDIEALKKQAEEAQQGLKNGDIDALKNLIGTFDPEMANTVESYKDTSNQINKYIRWYNLQLLAKKTNAYYAYLQNNIKKHQMMMEVDELACAYALKGLYEEEDRKLAALGPNSSPEEGEKISIEYALKRNKVRENYFHRNYDVMIYQYINTYKPVIEQMWADTMPHIRLIYEEKSRNKYYLNINEMAFTYSTQILGLIDEAATAWGNYEDYTYQDLQEAIERYREACRRAAEDDFKNTQTHDKFSINALLDRFSAKTSWLNGAIELKISPTEFEVTGAFIGAGVVNYNFDSGNLKVGAGVGIRQSTSPDVVPIGIGGEATTMLTLTLNTKSGDIQEIDWIAKAGAGGNIGSIGVGGSYEASVMHGNKFTPTVGGSIGNLNIDIVK